MFYQIRYDSVRGVIDKESTAITITLPVALDRALQAQGDGRFRDQLRRARADHVHAEQFVVLRFGDDLHEPFGLVRHLRPAEDAELHAGDQDIAFQGQESIAVGGDLIVAVDGKELTREHDLADEISGRGAGEKVELTVLRDGERRTISVELGRRPAGSGP